MPSSTLTDGKKRQQEAADWVARTDSQTLSATEEQHFTAWLKADTRNLGAYVQLKSTYAALNYKNATYAITPPPPLEKPKPRLERRRFFATACAAGLAGILRPDAIRDNFFSLRYRSKQAPAHYNWHGNHVTVDASSSAYFLLDHTRPLLQVINGRIGLHVQKKPVSVSIGGLRFGSKAANFDLTLHGTNVTLALYSGTLNWHGHDQDLHLHSPSLLTFSNTPSNGPQIIAKQKLTPDNALTQQAWRNGQIILSNTPLQAAVDEFNHYSNIECQIADTALGQHRISGSFSLMKLDDFISAVSQLLDCKVQKSANKVVFYT